MTDQRPPLFQVAQINFPTPDISLLANGLKVYMIEGGSQEVCKLDFMFLAGRPFEHKRLTAATMAGVLKEGSEKYTAATIADMVDQAGATMSSPFSFDHISLQLSCLNKYVEELLPLMIDVLRRPAFDKHEISLFKKRTERRLAVDLSNNEVIAYRKATEQYFGPQHPYGYNSEITLYRDVNRDDLKLHHEHYFRPNHAILFMAGRIPPALVDKINTMVESWEEGQPSKHPIMPEIAVPVANRIEEDMGKSQTAIRVGRRLFNRNHPDWPAIFVMNTVLGGYFGSRLMKHLREQKGLTYGVHSTVESLRYDGYLSISLETERKYARRALKGIYQEIEILQNELVPVNELQMVKNYLGGYLLSLMDGPLQTLEVLKNNLAEESPFDFTTSLLKQIASIRADDIRQMAQKYLAKDLLSEVIIY
ncbi:MAG: insulinase family protein [Saprospiraceae bacterium]|nr:insulinase family protein [Saprospiraceae bacterium]